MFCHKSRRTRRTAGILVVAAALIALGPDSTKGQTGRKSSEDPLLCVMGIHAQPVSGKTLLMRASLFGVYVQAAQGLEQSERTEVQRSVLNTSSRIRESCLKCAPILPQAGLEDQRPRRNRTQRSDDAPNGSPTTRTSPKLGESWTVPELGMELVYVAPGSFQMGSSDGDAYYHEKPVHTVHITKGFWMGRTEVTNGQYQCFVRESGYDGSKEADLDYLQHFRGGSDMSTDTGYPVCWVSWHNAAAFSRWLTEQERNAGRVPSGYVYRLPMEAEWEYAARGGSQSRHYKYSGASDLGAVGWYADNSRSKTHHVGAKRANELGLHDMSGNVCEWCRDWYGDAYYMRSPATDPAGPSTGESRVLRGGSWLLGPERCRCADRHWCSPKLTRNHRGFRIVLGWALD